MSLLNRLFGRPQTGTARPRPPLPALPYEPDIMGDIEIAVVGESNYQPALRDALARLLIDDHGEQVLPVRLRCEPTNRYDKNAVQVCTISGATLGYLSRDDAEDYCEAIAAVGGSVVTKARLRGGTPGKPSIGVWLDLCEPDEIR